MHPVRRVHDACAAWCAGERHQLDIQTGTGFALNEERNRVSRPAIWINSDRDNPVAY
jgi:hypothetical protein